MSEFLDIECFQDGDDSDGEQMSADQTCEEDATFIDDGDDHPGSQEGEPLHSNPQPPVFQDQQPQSQETVRAYVSELKERALKRRRRAVLRENSTQEEQESPSDPLDNEDGSQGPQSQDHVDPGPTPSGSLTGILSISATPSQHGQPQNEEYNSDVSADELAQDQDGQQHPGDDAEYDEDFRIGPYLLSTIAKYLERPPKLVFRMHCRYENPELMSYALRNVNYDQERLLRDAKRCSMCTVSRFKTALHQSLLYKLPLVWVCAFHQILQYLRDFETNDRLCAEGVHMVLTCLDNITRVGSLEMNHDFIRNIIDTNRVLDPLFETHVEKHPDTLPVDDVDRLAEYDEEAAQEKTRKFNEYIVKLQVLHASGVALPFQAFIDLCSKIGEFSKTAQGGNVFDSSTTPFKDASNCAKILKNTETRVLGLVAYAEGLLKSCLPVDYLEVSAGALVVESWAEHFTSKTNKLNKACYEVAKIFMQYGWFNDAGKVVERVYSDRRFVYVYRVVHETVSQAVWDVFQITKNPHLVELLTISSGNIESIVKFLTNSPERMVFKSITKSKKFISFQDGVFDTENLAFYGLHQITSCLPADQCSYMYIETPFKAYWDMVKDDIYPPGMNAYSHDEAVLLRKRCWAVWMFRDSDFSREKFEIQARQFLRKAYENKIIQRKRMNSEPVDFEDVNREVNLNMSSDQSKAFLEKKIQSMINRAKTTKKAKINTLFVNAAESIPVIKDFAPFSNEDMMKLPTPATDSIIFYQMPKSDDPVAQEVHNIEDYKMILALFGRMFYQVGQFDNWHVMPWITGIAGSGKSAIASHIMSCFPAGDVGLLANTIERQFGLSALQKKRIVVGTEIGRGFQLSPKEFLSMVVGEGMSTAKKFNEPGMALWIAHLLIIGNEYPEWEDTLEQYTRRIMNIPFMNRVEEKNPNLPNELLEERGPFILKCILAYHKLRYRLGSSALPWSVISPHSLFNASYKKTRATLNALVAFIEASEQVEAVPDGMVSEQAFNASFNSFLQKRIQRSCERPNIASYDVKRELALRGVTRVRIDGVNYFKGVRIIASTNPFGQAPGFP